MNKPSIVVNESYKGANTTDKARSFPLYNSLNLLGLYINSYVSLNNETEISNRFNFELIFTNI
jgi:hypothetical protein